MRIALVVLGLVVLAGCAWNSAPPIYLKEGVSAEQRQRDEVECVQVSLVSKAGPAGAVFLEEDRSAYHACMRGRGYKLVGDKSIL